MDASEYLPTLVRQRIEILPMFHKQMQVGKKISKNSLFL